MRLYNTLIRKKEEFFHSKDIKVGMYTCGPTVYWFSHVGNFRSYILSDVLKRVLVYNGFKVNHIINVTDVGHLTSDSDEGEDKMEKAASKEGKSVGSVANFYLNAFKQEFSKLNLVGPSKWVKATEHIDEQINLIKDLEKKGFTYVINDGVYFDTSKFKNYGKLSKKKIGGLKGGKRIDLGEKKNKTDFALWKFSGNKKRLQEWDSPWGVGFPGWHIECSAMSTKYLGKQFDIHTGGDDLVPIHHENEIAQSECGYGKSPWVKYWVHGAFLILPKGKMSKSSGKIKTISELEEDGIDPLSYKYFTYSAHYRKPLTWSPEALEAAVNGFKRLKNIIPNLLDDGKINKKYLKKFEERINDDLDMPGSISILWELVRDKKAIGKIGTIRKMDEIFGLRLLEKEELKIPEEIKKIAEDRAKARTKKDWKKSDELRENLKKKEWNIIDSGKDYILEKF
tara:strand:- start:661 stop:2019 length:1359 start_codon:yes stop_codon:yes gene_type:complete